jgi:hypothetical protein
MNASLGLRPLPPWRGAPCGEGEGLLTLPALYFACNAR